MELVKRAMDHQMAGEIEESIRLYKESIALCPTADAHTYLGWAYSFQGKLKDAIVQCEIAIQIDPDFGNPYNDIGAYLIEKGDLISAAPWLERAMLAPRYESYYYPHFNLARVYEQRGRLFEALKEYKAAIDLNPKYALAVRAFRSLQARLN